MAATVACPNCRSWRSNGSEENSFISDKAGFDYSGTRTLRSECSKTEEGLHCSRKS